MTWTRAQANEPTTNWSRCPWCGRRLRLTKAGRFYRHNGIDLRYTRSTGRPCRGAGRSLTDWRPQVTTVEPVGGVL